MKDEIPVLHSKLKKYERKSKRKSKDGKKQVSRRYMIPVRKEQIEGTNFQKVEDIIIMSEKDFHEEVQKSRIMNISNEKLKQSLNDKKMEIRDLNEQINQSKEREVKINDLKAQLTKEFKMKLGNIVKEYENEIMTLESKLDKQIKEYNAEIKSLRDLRALEKESFKIKLHEFELNNEEYEKLKKSHELLWDVVQKKDKKIKDLEKSGLVNNIFNKIKK
ncbi:MAG: hypothetical protein ACXVH2_08060 [Methanobacterium sp.]